MRLVRQILAAGLLGLVAAPVSAQTSARSQTLWYDSPATQWVEALPVGNGRLGAMVFGGIARERIQFNESTVWNGGPHDYARAGASRYLPRLRELLYADHSPHIVTLLLDGGPVAEPAARRHSRFAFGHAGALERLGAERDVQPHLVFKVCRHSVATHEKHESPPRVTREWHRSSGPEDADDGR